MRTIVLTVLATLASGPLHGQWINEPTKAIPRTADGQPDLSAPAPRVADGRPDLSGLWLMPLRPGYVANIAADLDAADVLPWAATLFDQRISDFAHDDPGTIGCLPMGPRHITVSPRNRSAFPNVTGAPILGTCSGR